MRPVVDVYKRQAIEFVDSDNKLISATKKEESLLYYPMETFAGIFFPAAKNMAGHWEFFFQSSLVIFSKRDQS